MIGKKKGKTLYFAAVGVLLFLAVCAGSFFLYQKKLSAAEKQRNLDMLSREIYQGAFFSTYDISNYPVENFSYYFGIEIIKADYRIRNVADLNDYLTAVFASDNALTNIYIGMDPVQLWKSCGKNIASVQLAFEEKLFSLADSFPGVSFEIFLSHPSMQHWLSLSKRDREISCILYQQFVQLLDGRENISVFYAGGQEWLIQNPANYIDSFTTTSEISEFLFLSHYSPGRKINNQNAAAMIEKTASLVAAAEKNPPSYPDLSQWDLIFLGDSVFGNYHGSLSIPGVVSSLSGASVYNCAQGGSTASRTEPSDMNFTKMAAEFVSGELTEADNNFALGAREYFTSPHQKKICFILNFGLNDYFEGAAPDNPADAWDESTYSGALRAGIKTLQDAYPDALYLIVTPGKATYFNNGTVPQSRFGGQLTDYYNCSRELAKEMGIPCLDLYSTLPQGEDTLPDILADGCHYNEYGRYLVGIEILNFLAEQLQ